jgi:hypothetical protein
MPQLARAVPGKILDARYYIGSQRLKSDECVEAGREWMMYAALWTIIADADKKRK